MTEYLKQLRILVKKNEDNEDMGIRVKYLWMRNKIKASNLAKKIDTMAP